MSDAFVGNQIGSEPFRAWTILSEQDDRLADLWMRGQRVLDLAELDSQSADLDLKIRPAQEFDLAIRQEIARDRPFGAYNVPARSAERIGNELFVQPSAPAADSAVAARDLNTADLQLAGHAD